MKFPEFIEQTAAQTGVQVPKVRKVLKAAFSTMSDIILSDEADEKIVTPDLIIRKKVIPANDEKPEVRRLTVDIKKAKITNSETPEEENTDQK